MAFNEVRIGDYFQLSKRLGYLGKHLKPSGVGLIGLNSFEAGGGYKFGGEKPYSGPHKEQHIARPGDLFIATTDITQDGRVLGSAFLLPSDIIDFESYIFSGDIVKAQPVTSEFMAEYLFNILRVKTVREKIAYASTGTTVRRVPVDVIENFLVCIPSLEIQKRICLILSSIDRKIRVNQQIASTLEQIAKTIFKSWFVDFDPVHAKARGEQPAGMDTETAALFPDSFEDSELGPIPSGWAVKAFGEACNLVMGQSPPGDFYNPDGNGLPFYQGRTDFGERFPARRMYTTAGKRTANEGETLISVRAPVGDINQAREECVIGRGVAAAMHKSGSEVFTYALLTHLQPQFAYFNGEGTVFGAINRKDFEALSVVDPSLLLTAKFEEVLAPTNAQIRNLCDQTESLTKLRDSLLPRLISGELEIPAELLEV